MGIKKQNSRGAKQVDISNFCPERRRVCEDKTGVIWIFFSVNPLLTRKELFDEMLNNYCSLLFNSCCLNFSISWRPCWFGKQPPSTHTDISVTQRDSETRFSVMFRVELIYTTRWEFGGPLILCACDNEWSLNTEELHTW